MPIYSPENSAVKNLEILAENEYPGRLLIQGFAGNVAVQAYAIEGRSEGSQNRVLVENEGIVSTDLYDKSKPVGDPELTIYNAMSSYKGLHVVSNGRQTDTSISKFKNGQTFQDAMAEHEYEPDLPNYTPRISAYMQIYSAPSKPSMAFSVIRKNAVSRHVMRDYYPSGPTGVGSPVEISNPSNTGYALHTYKQNAPEGDPLPSFDEAPFKVPIIPNADEMAHMLWEKLHPDNLVSVAAKTVHRSGPPKIAIINRHQ